MSRVARKFERYNLHSGPSVLNNSTFSLQPLLKGRVIHVFSGMSCTLFSL